MRRGLLGEGTGEGLVSCVGRDQLAQSIVADRQPCSNLTHEHRRLSPVDGVTVRPGACKVPQALGRQWRGDDQRAEGSAGLEEGQ